jgi:hypothetical protein
LSMSPKILQIATIITWLLTGSLFHPALSGEMAFGNERAHSMWPPPGHIVRCPVIGDTGISSVGEERYGSNGGSAKLKLKGPQEYVLMDFDDTSLRGKRIAGALLHLRSASAKHAPLGRIGISTVATRWGEGSAKRLGQQDGSACFAQAALRERDWSYAGSSLLDVVFGKGHTLWKFADCSPPDKDGWQTCAVDPDVIAANAAGMSHGICLSDEVGSEWSCRKGAFNYRFFPNRCVYSRESGNNAPWLEIWTDEGGEDTLAPGPITSLNVLTEGLPGGEAIIEWTTPEDAGGGKTLGFMASYQNDKGRFPVPRYLIPMAAGAGEKVRMHIRDMGFLAGEPVILEIRAVDGSGNIGAGFTQEIELSEGTKEVGIHGAGIAAFKAEARPSSVGGLKVGVVDLLDKIDPINGRMIPAHSEGYLRGNHLFSAKGPIIRLQAARNETVGFQLNLEGHAVDIAVQYAFAADTGLATKLYRFGYVRTGESDWKPGSILPDPLMPLSGAFSIPFRAGTETLSGQKNQSLVCEVYVPHKAATGNVQGKLCVRVGKESLKIPVQLKIWDFTLPDKLSFVPEMNAYDTVSPDLGYGYYRLAHEHRTCINRLPYGWDGIPEFAPQWDGKGFDWDAWDRYVGPLLDGSAFNDLPRAGEPVDVFYLPFSENWPVSLESHYVPSYWIEEAFSDGYRQRLKTAFGMFARHIDEKGWDAPVFQFYLNNKVLYREKFDRSSAPWIFDEPVDTQDFWALRWYGRAWHEAVDPFQDHAKLWFRCDISNSQFSRNMLWAIMDEEYVGANDAQKMRMKHDERVQTGKGIFAEYGTANPIDAPNLQPVLWCLSAWSRGAVGVLPWQTIGSDRSWWVAEQTALFYPHGSDPVPSVRLKAFMTGQQLVEYLTLYSRLNGIPRYAMRNWLRQHIHLETTLVKETPADAGTSDFEEARAIDLWKIRYLLGESISKRAPVYRRALVSLSSRLMKLDNLPEIGYVVPAPMVESYKPACDHFGP